MKKYKSVMQDGLMDCGVSSLLTIIKTYGGNVSKEYLRELTHTTKEGTNALYLLEAGKTLGFDTKALKGDILDLPNKYLPCIAHVIIDNKYPHFVVIQKIDRKKGLITISDPAKGLINMTLLQYRETATNHYLIFIPIKPIPIMERNNHIINIISKLLLKYKSILLSITIAAFLFTILNILGSFTFQLIIEHVIPFNSKTNLFFTILIIFALLVLKSLVDWLRSNLLNFMNHILDRTLVADIFHHIISLPYLYYKNRTTGEVVARINDLGDIKDVISNVFMTVFVDLILVIFVFLTLYRINSLLSMISIIILVLYLIIIKVFNKIMSSYIKKNQEEVARVNSYMIESINNIDTVKALGIEEQIENKMHVKYNEYLNTSYKFQKLFNVENFLKNIINDIGLLIIIFIGVTLVLNGKMRISEVITYNAMIVYFLEPIKNIIQLELVFKKTKISINRIIELYEVNSECLQLDNKYSGKSLQGHIQINDLNYSYYGHNNILKNINLDIPASNKVIIYGKSGSGKSTLGKILMKFLEVARDKVFVDDKDINDYNTLDIRREICYVGQNENLFTDTIYNNIVMDREVDYDHFLQVVKLTKVDEIIKSRNASYEMLLEENGFNISGGERQRLILARALLKNSSIYILDESLSQVDIERERDILSNLFAEYKDKTIIYISHRFHNMNLFDQQINMEELSHA